MTVTVLCGEEITEDAPGCDGPDDDPGTGPGPGDDPMPFGTFTAFCRMLPASVCACARVDTCAGVSANSGRHVSGNARDSVLAPRDEWLPTTTTRSPQLV